MLHGELTCPLWSHADLHPGHHLHCRVLQHNYSRSTRAVSGSPPAPPSALVLCPREQHPEQRWGHGSVPEVSDTAAGCLLGSQLCRAWGWLTNDAEASAPWDRTARPSPDGCEEGQRRNRSDNDLAQLVNLHLSI